MLGLDCARDGERRVGAIGLCPSQLQRLAATHSSLSQGSSVFRRPDGGPATSLYGGVRQIGTYSTA